MRTRLSLPLLFLFLASLQANAQEFFFDNSFGSNGRVITPLTVGDADHGTSVAIQPDGRIVAACRRDAGGGNFLIAVLRFLPDGTLDSTFSTNGIATISFGQSCYPDAVAVRSDGKIVVGGTTYHPTEFNDLLFARMNSDGSLDGTFGSGGMFTISSPAAQDHVMGMSAMPDGRLLASAQLLGGFSVMRFLNDGSPDPSFNSNGQLLITDGTIFSGRGLAIMPDDRILVTGSSVDQVDTNYAVIRSDVNGAYDDTFGDTGVVRSIDPDHLDDIFNANLLADGKLLLVGVRRSLDLQHYSVLLRRMNADGTWDNSFGTNSTTVIPVTGSDVPNVNDVVTTADGKLFMANAITDSLTTDRYIQFTRLSADGVLDPSFGVGGILSWHCDGSSYCDINDLLVQSDGRVVGIGTLGQVGNTDALTVRLFPQVVAGVEDVHVDPATFSIAPDPASDHVVLQFDLPTAQLVSMDLFDPLARKSVAIADRYFPAGRASVQLAWSGDVPNGSYFVRVRTNDGARVQHLIIQR